MRMTICAGALALMTAACSSETPDQPQSDAALPGSAETAQPAEPDVAPSSTTAARTSQFSKTTDCKVIESTSDEGGYFKHACTGPAGHSLTVTESDLRQNVEVNFPGGATANLKLSSATRRSGFNEVGETVEWRGTGEGANWQPDALVLRYLVQDQPEASADTPYLLVVRLDGTKSCITHEVAPGANQNDQARAVADDRTVGQCLS